MRDHPQARLGAELQAILRHATVADLRSDADELAALVRAIRRPFPASLPVDPDEREFALLILAFRARDQAQRLLALLVERM